MALSVKAYIHPDTNQQEIRRFAIDEGVSASYAYLAQKIEQVFPVVRGKIFKLFWKGKAYLVYFILNLLGGKTLLIQDRTQINVFSR